MRRKTRNVPVIRWRNHWKALERADRPNLLGIGAGVLGAEVRDERGDARVAADDEEEGGDDAERPEEPLLVRAPPDEIDEHDAEPVERVVDDGAEEQELADLEDGRVVARD